MTGLKLKSISVILISWVLVAPGLNILHSLEFHRISGKQTVGLCEGNCDRLEHRNPAVKHDWCQIRVYHFPSPVSTPTCSFLPVHLSVVEPERFIHQSITSSLPPSRASPSG